MNPSYKSKTLISYNLNTVDVFNLTAFSTQFVNIIPRIYVLIEISLKDYNINIYIFND